MNIFSTRRSSGLPHIEPEFKTLDELVRHVQKNAFRQFRAGTLFLLIKSIVAHRLIRSGMNPEYDDFLEREFFVGVCGKQPEFNADEHHFIVQAERSVLFQDSDRAQAPEAPAEGPIRFPRIDFRYTPFARKVSDPQGRLREPVPTLLFVTGIKRMDALCMQEGQNVLHDKDFREAYILALRMLGRSPFHPELKSAEERLKEEIIGRLLTQDRKHLELSLKRARLLGLYEQRKPVRVSGIRYWPKELIRDLTNP